MTDIKTLSEMKHKQLVESCAAFPAAYVPRPKYSDRTANGLTRCIIDYITLTGGHAERVNTTGRIINHRGKATYIPTTGKRGSADIHAVKGGRMIAIEVKIGLDRQSPAQAKYQSQVTACGGVYIIARTFEDFIQQWDAI